MDVSTLAILMGIGLVAGVFSGLLGIGGGVILVPALIYFLQYDQLQAQGISLALMLPPITILSCYAYYTEGHLSKQSMIYAGIMSVVFIVGGYLGGKIATKIPVDLIKLIFGLLMLYVGIRMIIGGMGFFNSDVTNEG